VLDFFTAASEHERVAALQPHMRSAPSHAFDGVAGASAPPRDIDAPDEGVCVSPPA